MKTLANNDELKKQIEGVSQSLDLNKLINFTESFLQEEQKKEQHIEESSKSEDKITSSLKGLGDFITEENLVSMVGMAKNLVNPSTLSLLSKLNNPIQKQEGNPDTTKLMLTIEQLSSELKKVHIELDQIKQILSAIRQQNSFLQNELLSLTNRRRR